MHKLLAPCLLLHASSALTERSHQFPRPPHIPIHHPPCPLPTSLHTSLTPHAQSLKIQAAERESAIAGLHAHAEKRKLKLALGLLNSTTQRRAVVVMGAWRSWAREQVVERLRASEEEGHLRAMEKQREMSAQEMAAAEEKGREVQAVLRLAIAAAEEKGREEQAVLRLAIAAAESQVKVQAEKERSSAEAAAAAEATAAKVRWENAAVKVEHDLAKEEIGKLRALMNGAMMALTLDRP